MGDGYNFFNPGYLLGGLPGLVISGVDAIGSATGKGNVASDWLSGLWNDVTGVTAAETAAEAQTAATEQAVEALSPYQEAGEGAIGQMQALSGAGGAAAQAEAMQALQNSPGFQAMLRQGETSILQNAAATGGLRGGNTQSALAQYSPMLLQQHLQNQYSNLSGLAGIGAGAAGGVGNLQTRLGDISAATALARHQLPQQTVQGAISGLGDIAKIASSAVGLF
jgi:hypothetical protein